MSSQALLSRVALHFAKWNIEEVLQETIDVEKRKCNVSDAMHNSGKKPINQLVPGSTR